MPGGETANPLNAPQNSRESLLRVLFIGEQPERAAPFRTLAAALGRYGIAAEFAAGAEFGSTLAWIKRVRQVAALIMTRYDAPDLFHLRQIALARAAGRPIVRWWVGSDVFACLENGPIRRGAQTLDKFVTLNIAVAPHLVDELASIGIAAQFVPSVLAFNPQSIAVDSGPPPAAVLVYLPADRDYLFDEEIIRRAVEANPDLKFLVVGENHHSLAGFANVESLGWVEDMESLWQRVGGLLRITRHDGLPRMVLDALLRGKYVVYSWPLEGCFLAKTFDEVQAGLCRMRAAQEANLAGAEAVRTMLQPDPAGVYADWIRRIAARRGIGHRLRCFAAATALTGRAKFDNASGVL